MRFLITLLTTAALFCGIASTAGAVEFSIVGSTSAMPVPGETVTIHIVMTNTSATPVYGLAASVSGYGKNEFVSGRAVGNYLNQVCVPGGCFGGLTNLAGQGNLAYRDLAESAIGANGNRVQIALSASLSPALGVPRIDQGIDGVSGSTQFMLTFIFREHAILHIGTSYQGDGVILEDGSTIQAQGAVFGLVLIPEPGTALLIGLGLAGLASAGRRE